MAVWTLLLLAPLSQTAIERAATAAMSGRQGTVVVLDVNSGSMVASHRVDVAERRLARPGSVIKPFTLLALLREHKISVGTAVDCRREVRIGGRRFDCSHPPSALPLDATAALAYSCNYFFATLSGGLRDLSGAFQRAGLTGSAGWVRAGSSLEERQLLAIGESGIEVTPLEVATAYRKLAQRRTMRVEFDAGMEAIYTGLEAATAYGTAQQAQPRGVRVAGKTGTTSSNAWFAGFAPAAAPRLVVVVLLDHGTGGADAAPIAGQIFATLAK